MKTFKSFVFAIIFLLRLASSTNKDILSYLRRCYSDDVVKVFKNYSKFFKKLEKSRLDVSFLTKCKIYNVFPKFLRFKLYKQSLNSSQFYKAWQAKLLINELNCKRRAVSKFSELLEQEHVLLTAVLSPLDLIITQRHAKKVIGDFIQTTEITHERKLRNLGIENDIKPCDAEKVIFNYSSIILPSRLKFLLAFGLDFCLPIYKLNFYKYFICFEKLSMNLKNESCVGNFNEFRDQLKSLAFKYFYSFKPYKIFSSVFKQSDFSLLKKFASNPDIVISKPDKGKGVVIVNRHQYVSAMTQIISDRTKFQEIVEPIYKLTLRIEDKINNFLRKLKTQNLISDSVYKQLFVTGSAPGTLYGLPKVHKPDFSHKFQYRPIFAAFRTPCFKLAKFLVPILNPYTVNDYTVKDSEHFVRDITALDNANFYYMASFDIENLFTNIPLNETIDICVSLLFENCTHVIGLTSSLFRTLVELSVLNSFFIFDKKFYKQIEGLGMGLPLGPTFANIFMCFHEKRWLLDCPDSFKPVFYRRYVDDTFLLFRHPSHAQYFLDYLNSKHASIKFTMELESRNKLCFLDCNITRCNNKFESSVYRKPMFTGLGLSYFSFCPTIFKNNSISTLLFRAYKVSSTYFNLCTELDFLQSYFHRNGYPIPLIKSKVKHFLNSKFVPQLGVATVDKRQFYFSLPYFGFQSEKLKKELDILISKFYIHLDVKIVLSNKFTVGSFFKFKDNLPKNMCSSLVYKFSCVHSTSEYVGSTTRALRTRVSEHVGRSHRTGAPLSKPPHSAIRNHSDQCVCEMSLDNFKILGYASEPSELRILESLFIAKIKPSLNDTNSAFPLQIVHF